AMDENEKGIEGSEVKRRETVQEMNEDKSENTIIDDLTPSTARKKQYCVCNKERNVFEVEGTEKRRIHNPAVFGRMLR
ncbi:hypothetical protein SNEBB_004981, partial [Seison nebaliae]